MTKGKLQRCLTLRYKDLYKKKLENILRWKKIYYEGKLPLK